MIRLNSPVKCPKRESLWYDFIYMKTVPELLFWY